MPANSVSPTRERIVVGGIPFEVSSLDHATREILDFATARVGVAVRLANAYCVAAASTDRAYRRVLVGEGFNYPDGVPVVWFMKINRFFKTNANSVRGPTLFERVIEDGQSKGIKHYFLGTTPETLQMLITNLESKYPAIRVAGSFAPPISPMTQPLLETFRAHIQAAGADLVWVALGSPKQDFVTLDLAGRCSVPCVGVGAAFDFVAGNTKEAPRVLQGSGFEWVYRLTTEPRRLWKRYLFGNFKFIIAAATKRRGYEK